MMRLIYTLGIRLFLLAIRILSLFNSKAKLWLKGRKGLFDELEKNLKDKPRLYWFHCASLGEFEQGRPLIEKLKAADPSHKILLTFFSPSGYRVRRHSSGADYVFYIPSDTPAHARRFLDIVKPEAVFFVKYEFWYNFLYEIGERKIPAYLVSGIFRSDQHFFKRYGSWFKERLNCFTRFYLQDKASADLLMKAGFSNVLVTGDTRFDRVTEIAQSSPQLPLAEIFCKHQRVLVAGSTWEADEDLLASLPLKEKGFRLIIAPHEISEEAIGRTMRLFEKGKSVVCYSKAGEKTVQTADVLIIDNIGLLSALYRYGTLAYIGGGFGDGIHNILEPAVFGLPVIFGPRYHKFSEAHELIQAGGAFAIQDKTSLLAAFSLLTGDPLVTKMASEISRHYVKKNTGACDRIMGDIQRPS